MFFRPMSIWKVGSPLLSADKVEPLLLWLGRIEINFALTNDLSTRYGNSIIKSDDATIASLYDLWIGVD